MMLATEEEKLVQPIPARRGRLGLVLAGVGLAAVACAVVHAAVAQPRAGSALRSAPSRALSGDSGCAAESGDPQTVNVMTFNLYWWCTSDMYGNCPQFANGRGFNLLYGALNQNQPFDLLGLQECNNVQQIVANTAYGGCMDYASVADAALAWNTQKYQKLGDVGNMVTATDQYGARYVQWVRLLVKATGQTILFANTHGPLGQCGGAAGDKVAAAYVSAIESHKQPGDLLVFTGDFNCGSTEETLVNLAKHYENAAVDTSYNGADHIFVNGGLTVEGKQILNGGSSDHQLLKAELRLPGPSPRPITTPPPSPPPSPGPSPQPTPSGCPVPPSSSPCCKSCQQNRFCPTNNGCYATGQYGCPTDLCPAPTGSEVSI